MFEVHSWEQLSPFFNIARMIDVMTFFIKIMLIAIVLISIMNVMIMAVYERIREIGTIAAIGTLPGKIRSMFIIEGFCLGIVGAIIGDLLGSAVILIVNLVGIRFDFGQQQGLLLKATLQPIGSVDRIGHCYCCRRGGQPSTGHQSIEDGTDRGLAPCLTLKGEYI